MYICRSHVDDNNNKKNAEAKKKKHSYSGKERKCIKDDC